MRLTDPIIREGPQLAVDYVAFDSLGVMGMCTCITTPEITVTIDPGASVEPGSFPLPVERRHALLDDRLAAVRAACARSQAIVVSHYHLDHLLPERDPELYGDKIVFLRDPETVTPKQAAVGRRFLRVLDGLAREVIFADGRRFKYRKSEIAFSGPVWHGNENAEPGTVIMTQVSRGRERVLVTSDVGGPLDDATVEAIIGARAATVILDGYPTYKLGQFATDHDLVRSITSICRVLAARDVRAVVIDHHLARDYRYPAYFRLAYDKARALGKRLGTAAELNGRTSAVLQGYQDYGPTRWHKWAPLERDEARGVLQRAIGAGSLPASVLADFDRWV
jgi:predicted metallo-beta-lactamase superfamily hydrolase